MAEDGTYCRECGRPWEDKDELDAQRYRKMRAAWILATDSPGEQMDAAADALPEGEK